MPTLPTLPQSEVDTTYSLPTGTTHVCTTGAQFATALTNAALNDVIELQAGNTFTGPFTLPNKTSGSGWIYIVSSALASLPASGTRVTASDASNMPEITASSGNSVFTTANTAHHLRLVGLHIHPASGTSLDASTVAIGGNTAVEANIPHHIIVDRCYIHGDATLGARRGVEMDGDNVAVIECHISDFKQTGNDTQACWAYNCHGPLKIHNNYLEAAAENIMFGGAEPQITDMVPSDITITRNHIFKPLDWISLSWSVKNLLELKLGKRVLIKGNVLENCWLASQAGWGMLITPRNENGNAPWAEVSDVTVQSNRWINLGQWLTIAGQDSPNVSEMTARVLIDNNEAVVTELNGANGFCCQHTNGGTDITWRHNTVLITSSGGYAAFHESTPEVDQFDWTDNLVTQANGWIGTAQGNCNATLAAYFTNYTFDFNAIIGPSFGNYPANNFFPANNAAVSFVDFAGGDYRLQTSSTYHNAASDGTDIGADIDAIDAAIAGTEGGGSAPVLTGPTTGTATQTGCVSATVTTDESGGTLYWAFVTNGGSCTDAQLIAGSGGNIISSVKGSQAVASLGVQTLGTINGLQPNTTFQIKYLHRDSDTNNSNQASASLTTNPPNILMSQILL